MQRTASGALVASGGAGLLLLVLAAARRTAAAGVLDELRGRWAPRPGGPATMEWSAERRRLHRQLDPAAGAPIDHAVLAVRPAGRLCRARQGRLVDDGRHVRRRRARSTRSSRARSTGRASTADARLSSTAWRSTTMAPSSLDRYRLPPRQGGLAVGPCARPPPAPAASAAEQQLVRVGSMSIGRRGRRCRLHGLLAAVPRCAPRRRRPSSSSAPSSGRAADESEPAARSGAARHRHGDRGPTRTTVCRLEWTQRDPGRRPARRAGRQVPPRRGAAGAGARPVLLPGAVGYDPFARARNRSTRSRATRCAGAWSAGEALDVFTFAILEDGTYELQASRRRSEPRRHRPRVRPHRRRRGGAAHDRPRGPGRVAAHGAGAADRSSASASPPPALARRARPGPRTPATCGSAPAASPAPTIPSAP